MLASWHNEQAFVQDNKCSTRVLALTSGNIQPFVNEDSTTLPKPEQDHHSHGSSNYQNAVAQLPPPRSTLASNDAYRTRRQKLASTRLHQRLKLAQAYLQHPKYIHYKSRVRQDIDKKTGQAIWPEDVENAFQHACLNILPMGRRKKSQHGRPYGRNELIAEWIRQETGQHRTRKQVSSHVQVLDGLFKHCAEWRSINKVVEDPALSDADFNSYYNNSVEDMVRDWRRLQAVTVSGSVPYDGDVLMSSSVFEPSGKALTNHLAPKNRLKQIEFDMWVSHADSMNVPLHKYTSVQSNTSAGIARPLESISGWKSNFPDLPSILDSLTSGSCCDIIHLSASFRLMADFPPDRSKLGISFGLEFCDIQRSHPGGPAFLDSWSCVTHMYQRGKFLRRTEAVDCQTSGPGIVKPPFESKWWAHEFVRLTSMCQTAMESNDDAAIAAANESARKSLAGLTMMQEISAVSEYVDLGHGYWENTKKPQKRMAVLLWTFSQAPKDFVGTTTWHQIVPPPLRNTVNSPLPASMESLSLAPLPLNSSIVGSTNDNEMHIPVNMYTHPNPDTIPMYTTDGDEELCQDGFMMVPQHETFYMGHGMNLTMSPRHATAMHAGVESTFELCRSTHQTDDLVQDGQNLALLPHLMTNNLFEIPQQHLGSQGHENQFRAYSGADQELRDSDHHQHREPLVNFDANTHRVLQEQLGDTGVEHENSFVLVQPMHHAMNAHQGLGPTSQTPIHENIDHGASERTWMLATRDLMKEVDDVRGFPMSSGQSMEGNESSRFAVGIESPGAVRPLLQSHHSFAGVLPVDINHLSTSRRELSQVLENLSHHEDTFGDDSMLIVPTPEQSVRSHSQPPSGLRYEDASAKRQVKGEVKGVQQLREHFDLKVEAL